MNAALNIHTHSMVPPSEREVIYQELREIDDSPGGFRIAFQPRVDVHCGHTVSAEALIRWDNGRGTVRYPGQFLALVEDLGYMAQLDNWVLQRAIEQGAGWERNGGPRISVNVSVRQIESPRFPQRVESMLAAAGLSANRLEIEVNENTVIRDQSSAGRTLHEVREMGVDVALDDFGTGSMTMTKLQWMPVNVIKIDQDMCERIAEDAHYKRLARAMVAFAKSMNAKSVLEGVELVEQFNEAVSAGFDEVQGYFFSHAVAGRDVIRDFSTRINQAPVR